MSGGCEWRESLQAETVAWSKRVQPRAAASRLCLNESLRRVLTSEVRERGESAAKTQAEQVVPEMRRQQQQHQVLRDRETRHRTSVPSFLPLLFAFLLLFAVAPRSPRMDCWLASQRRKDPKEIPGMGSLALGLPSCGCCFFPKTFPHMTFGTAKSGRDFEVTRVLIDMSACTSIRFTIIVTQKRGCSLYTFRNVTPNDALIAFTLFQADFRLQQADSICSP